VTSERVARFRFKEKLWAVMTQVLGTYRPTDVIVSGHPLKVVKQELQIHGYCAELPLGFLHEPAVAEYLTLRFPGEELPSRLAPVVYQSTDGNPLFMVNVAEYVAAQGMMGKVDGQWQLTATTEEIAIGVAESLRQIIEKQIERLTAEERRVLEVASVVGRDFSAGAVAAGLVEAVEAVEAVCEEIVRRGHFLQSAGMETLPNGMVAGRYRFLHAVYQSVLYGRVAAAHRTRLHRRIGEREEAVYGSATRANAPASGRMLRRA
jgi:predicted ATPase